MTFRAFAAVSFLACHQPYPGGPPYLSPLCWIRWFQTSSVRQRVVIRNPPHLPAIPCGLLFSGLHCSRNGTACKFASPSGLAMTPSPFSRGPSEDFVTPAFALLPCGARVGVWLGRRMGNLRPWDFHPISHGS